MNIFMGVFQIIFGFVFTLVPITIISSLSSFGGGMGTFVFAPFLMFFIIAGISVIVIGFKSIAKELTLTNINSKDNYALINSLINLGAEMQIKKDCITINKIDRFDKLNIKTGVYPSFPSDLQQIMTTLLFYGEGISLVEETLFENRFSFLNQIKKMGGKYFIYDNKVLVIPSKLNPEIIECEDLRGGAALLLAAMSCEGESIVKNVEYIERGYENIVEVLNSVNVDIEEIEIYEA